MRLRLDLAYDGTAFSGWARQPHRPSVQESVEIALARALKVPVEQVRTVVAGRTDAGVHATGQVCHIDVDSSTAQFLESPDAMDRLLRRIRGALGRKSAIWLSGVEIAAPGFDARFSPLERQYEYRIADTASGRDPRLAGHTVWWDESLDLAMMNSLGERLLGLNDFAAFCRPRAGATTIRTLREFRWRRDEGGVLVASVVADAFCHSMVRSLVGAAVAVGTGKLSVDEVVHRRDQRLRTSAWKTMPAHGLTLTSVVYPEAGELEARATLTRAKRDSVSD